MWTRESSHSGRLSMTFHDFGFHFPLISSKIFDIFRIFPPKKNEFHPFSLASVRTDWARARASRNTRDRPRALAPLQRKETKRNEEWMSSYFFLFIPVQHVQCVACLSACQFLRSLHMTGAHPSGSIQRHGRKAKASPEHHQCDIGHERQSKSREGLRKQNRAYLGDACERSVSEDDARRKQMIATKCLDQGACAITQPASFYLL